MTIADKATNFRFDIGADSYQLPDTAFLRWYNEWRDELIDTIIWEKEDFFYNYIGTQTVIWQNEYKIPKRWDLDEDEDNVTVLDWMAKIKGISWKIKADDTEYTKLVPKKQENLEKDMFSYSDTVEPFYILQDNSIFIFPTPTEVSDLRIYWIVYYKQLELTDEENLPDNYIKGIMYYVKKKWLESQQRLNEAQVQYTNFENEKIRIIGAISWRVQDPVYMTQPNLSYLS